VPVADIYTFLRSLIRCCVLYSFFAPGESLTNAILLSKVWKMVGNSSSVNFASVPRNPRKALNPQLQLQQQRISPDLFIGSAKINLSLVVMMSAVNPCKPPQPPRRQRVGTKIFCAFNVRISDISCKSARQQACGIFHPQDPTEYPRHFQSLCTIGNASNGPARLISLSLYI